MNWINSKTMENLSQNNWKKAVQNDANAEILDVRTAEEFEEGFIPKAKLLDIHQPEEFMNNLNTMDKSKSYYIYCRSGSRSTQACQVMEQLGFENTYNLEGGFSKWDGKKETNPT